jgi:hypothetical protein
VFVAIASRRHNSSQRCGLLVISPQMGAHRSR